MTVESAPKPAVPETPHVGSLRPGPATGVVLYLLLALALLASLVGDRFEGLPPAVPALAPVVFGVFLVVFALYRYALVRAGRYPFGRALFQVGAGVAFVGVLLARHPAGAQPAGAADLGALLDAQDPTVRQLACEVARYRPGGAASLERVRAHAGDEVPAVAAECARSAQALGGR